MKLFKQIVVFLWVYRSNRTFFLKFKLYGKYKALYSWPGYKLLSQHKELFKPFKLKVSSEWYKYFTLVRQEENINYIPENIWHLEMEPVLNARSFAKAFNDKNLFDLLPYQNMFPTTILHVIKGIIYDKEYKRIDNTVASELIKVDKDLVVKKAVDSGGGKGVGFYNGMSCNLETLLHVHGEDFIIQEEVVQNDWFMKLNPGSLNTIRVITYRRVTNEEVVVLQTLLRVGKPGSKVDNQSSGGVAVGINDKGVLNSWGSDKLSQKFNDVNGVQLSNYPIVPSFEKLKNECVEIAKQRFHERVLVFDTWQDVQGRIRLVEINNINIGIEDLQKNNGPMFGEYTQEVVDYCSTNKKSYCFDYEI